MTKADIKPLILLALILLALAWLPDYKPDPNQVQNQQWITNTDL